MLILREPKGRPQQVADEAEAGPKNQATLTDALTSKAFWIFAGSAAAFNLVASGLGLFNEAVLRERGFDQATFHLFLAVTTLMSLGGQFLCGWLTRRWNYQRLTLLALVLYGASLAGIPFLTRHWQLWILSVLFGAAGGMIIVIFFSVWSDLFGQKHLGRIQGAAQMLTVLSRNAFRNLFATQPWRRLRTWQDGRYQYALCEKG